MTNLFFILLFIILVYPAAWLGELNHCMKKQIKHNEFWEARGQKPFIDFCRHL